MQASAVLLAGHKTTTTDHVFAFLTIPPLLILIYMLGGVMVHWNQVRGIQDRREVLRRALGVRNAKIATYGLIGWALLLLIGVAIFHGKMT